MEFNIKSGQPEKQRTACLVLGVFENRRLTPTGKHLDKISQGHLSNVLKRGDMDGQAQHTALLYDVPHILAERVLLIGCGKERDFNEAKYQKLVHTMVSALNDTGAKDAICYLPELGIKNRDLYWKVRQAVEHASSSLYRLDVLKSNKEPPRQPLRRLTFAVATRRELPLAELAVDHGTAIAKGVSFAKNLANLPGNICTPDYLADEAKKLAKTHAAVKVEVLDEDQMTELGMGAFMAVTQGSDREGHLIILRYQGAADATQKPIVLIGKGITFDTGGICLKSPSSINGMKYDMCGAASVMAVLQIAVELKLPLNVIVIVATAENMPSGGATRPDDIVTTLSKQTVEIGNTDAEGRLVLCDALTYAERFEPDFVIDVATLTGACIVALGQHASGLFTNYQPLATDLIQAGQQSYDRVWQMPVWDDYQSQLDSKFADMNNVGGSDAGSITAACFLSRFAKKFHWAHLDIAGTAHVRGKEAYATGRPVPLLAQYLLNQVAENTAAK